MRAATFPGGDLLVKFINGLPLEERKRISAQLQIPHDGQEEQEPSNVSFETGSEIDPFLSKLLKKGKGTKRVGGVTGPRGDHPLRIYNFLKKNMKGGWTWPAEIQRGLAVGDIFFESPKSSQTEQKMNPKGKNKEYAKALKMIKAGKKPLTWTWGSLPLQDSTLLTKGPCALCNKIIRSEYPKVWERIRHINPHLEKLVGDGYVESRRGEPTGGEKRWGKLQYRAITPAWFKSPSESQSHPSPKTKCLT